MLIPYADMFSYYGIAGSITIGLINYALLGFQFEVDGYFMHAFEIWLATTVVFWGSGTIGYTLLEYRLGRRSLVSASCTFRYCFVRDKGWRARITIRVKGVRIADSEKKVGAEPKLGVPERVSGTRDVHFRGDPCQGGGPRPPLRLLFFFRSRFSYFPRCLPSPPALL